MNIAYPLEKHPLPGVLRRHRQADHTLSDPVDRDLKTRQKQDEAQQMIFYG
jgi:hypothetical protein